MRFPSGDRWVVEWAGTEPLTVPRHTRVRSVRSYFAAPRAAALGGRVGPLAAPFVRQSGRVGGNPSAERRAGNTVDGRRRGAAAAAKARATLVGRDTYGLAALLVAQALSASRPVRRAGLGALAPAEAFDAARSRPRLAPLLTGVEGL